MRLAFHHVLLEQLQPRGRDPPLSFEILHFFLKLDSYRWVLLKLLKTLTAEGSSHVQMPRKQRCCPEHLFLPVYQDGSREDPLAQSHQRVGILLYAKALA